MVGTTLTFPDVLSVHITDTKQRLLLSKSQKGATLDGATLAGSSQSTAGLVSETNDAWHFSAPVFGGQGDASPFELQERQPTLLGYVHVEIGKGTLNKLTLSLLIGNLVITLSFAIVLLAIVRMATRHMINPLNALSALMHRAEGGESGMRAVPAGPRDLIDMATAFNKMMDVLESREAELKESRDAAVSRPSHQSASTSTM